MSFLSNVLEHDSGRPFLRFIDDNKWRSYGEMFRIAERVAGWLKEQGVERGSRVIIQLDTGRDLVLAHLACLVLGAIRVPLHYRQPLEEIQPIIDMTQPSLAITCQPDYFVDIPAFTRLKAGVPVTDWAVGQQDTEWLFTSGSTGIPKGVRRTMDALENCSNALTARWDLCPDDVLHISLPWNHAHALDIAFAGVMHRGARIIISPRFLPHHPPPRGATMVWAVPTNWKLLLEKGNRIALDGYRGLRLAVSGSDYLPPEVALAIREATGLQLANRLASTENLVYAATPRRGDWFPDTVGFPLSWVDLKLSEGDGEILIRRHQFFRGYEPEVEPSGFVGEWFGTGDIGTFHESGQLIHLGRTDDIIKRGGEKIGPAEIETVLLRVDGVAKAGCFPVPDAHYGQVVGAAIVLSDNFQNERTVLAACQQECKTALGPPKQPAFWFVVDAKDFPETGLGKIKRKQLGKICLDE